MSDALRSRIDALVGAAPSLSSAADSVGTIGAGSDVVVSNFAGVEVVLDRLADFFNELKDGSWYAPVGLVSPFAGVSAPVGWLLCDGAAVSQTTYAALFTVIGSTYDVTGPGAGNFRVPDLRGRAVAGVDNMGGSDAGRLSLANTLGTAGGAETMPAHSHGITDPGHGHGVIDPGHTHGINSRSSSGQGSPFNAALTGANQGPNGAVVLGAGTGISIQGAGTGISVLSNGTGNHGVVQPTIVLNYIIKA